MEEKEKTQEQPKKFTYEQLENIASSLSGQVQQLTAKLQEANLFNVFKRLDYLFKIVEFANSFPAEFVEKATKEVMELMAPPSKEEETTDK